MKVLFISSGNAKYGISPIVESQGESLKDANVEIEYYTILGKGVIGYLKNILNLRKHIKKNRFDLLHAHYSLSAFVTSIASIGLKIPVVVSLMGSDTESTRTEKYLVKLFNKIFWKKLIVKSVLMKNKIGVDSADVIPNGVNIKMFRQTNIIEGRTTSGFTQKKIVLFAANPKRFSKNYQLAENAFEYLPKDKIKLSLVYNLRKEEIPSYINTSDVLLLTSHYEGSPNIVKEAMACNCPIVSTNVGDVEWLFGDEPGHFLTSSNPDDVAEKIRLALKFAEEKGRTNGRQRIISLGLDSDTVAKKIIAIYKEALKYAE